MAAASPAEWLAAGSLGVSAISVIALAMSCVDADLDYFDPRYQLARLVESGAVDPLLIVVGPVLAASREAARDAAALLILLTTSPKAGTR